MQKLQDRIVAANTLLAAYAVPIEGTLGRKHPEEPDETRFPFQRDRDRIIHSLAFRRLKGKTQVFVAGEGDHYRTRLTHSMEVAQISRDIARTMGLNEDLAESIALAHDLGHPPFGHAGEEALDAWMHEHGSHFEHNEQSLRIVTTLETHSSLHTGLNLSFEILEGLMKHRTPHDSPALDHPRKPSLEAQVVNIADEIAYTGHDCDDGLRAGLFDKSALMNTPLAREAYACIVPRGTSFRGALIHLMVSDLYTETERRLALKNIRTLQDIYERAEDCVAFSESMAKKLVELRTFLWNNMYLHPEVRKHSSQGQAIVTELCQRLYAQPNDKVVTLMKVHSCSAEEAVKDYVAGMTDVFATANARDL
ncbi:dNTP triphosphohydrolase [Candidatus Peregrinibacteria bacterium]|nr:dNTP triphosphohydrolase [Candidatus Peregrinibacteria bacterium]